jgi:hypothetical protein
MSAAVAVAAGSLLQGVVHMMHPPDVTPAACEEHHEVKRVRLHASRAGFAGVNMSQRSLAKQFCRMLSRNATSLILSRLKFGLQDQIYRNQ